MTNGLAYTAVAGLMSSLDWPPAKVANFNADTGAGGKLIMTCCGAIRARAT
jgi:hypothetical protein